MTLLNLFRSTFMSDDMVAQADLQAAIGTAPDPAQAAGAVEPIEQVPVAPPVVSTPPSSRTLADVQADIATANTTRNLLAAQAASVGAQQKATQTLLTQLIAEARSIIAVINAEFETVEKDLEADAGKIETWIEKHL